MTQFGKYDQRIAFVKLGTTPDGAGGHIPKREVLLSSWSSIEQLKVRKDIEQAQENLPATYRVKMQPRAGFNPEVENLVEWNSKTYVIVSTPQVEGVRMKRELVFDMSSYNG